MQQKRGADMHSRTLGSDWQKSFWKIVKIPTVEVVAAILVVMGAVWIVVLTETEQHRALFPVPFVHQ